MSAPLMSVSCRPVISLCLTRSPRLGVGALTSSGAVQLPATSSRALRRSPSYFTRARRWGCPIATRGTVHGENHRNRLDLARWGVRPLAGCHRPRALPLAAVRVLGVRGNPLLRHPARSGDLPPRGSPPADARLLQDLSNGRQVHDRRAGIGLL